MDRGGDHMANFLGNPQMEDLDTMPAWTDTAKADPGERPAGILDGGVLDGTGFKDKMHGKRGIPLRPNGNGDFFLGGFQPNNLHGFDLPFTRFQKRGDFFKGSRRGGMNRPLIIGEGGFDPKLAGFCKK